MKRDKKFRIKQERKHSRHVSQKEFKKWGYDHGEDWTNTKYVPYELAKSKGQKEG